MRRKTHLVNGLLADGTAATFALCEQSSDRDSLEAAIGLEPAHRTLGGVIVRVDGATTRGRLMGQPDWKLCLRCGRGQHCAVVSGEISQLAHIPFLFSAIMSGGEVVGGITMEAGEMVGGDHSTFNSERRRLKLTEYGTKAGATLRDLFQVASAVESAVGQSRSGLHDVFNAASRLIGLGKDIFGTVAAPSQQQPHVETAGQEQSPREAAAFLNVPWPCTPEQLKAAWRREAINRHTDHGGTEDAFNALVRARKTLEKALGVTI